MATAAQNLKLKMKKLPLDEWSTREQLALACSVMRSGDQNWVSVSRAIKAFGEDNRPPDWFSQKNCALQYSSLLEKVETPKRKRGDKGDVVDTPGDLIARKLSNERIEELKQLVQQTKKQYIRLRRQAEMIRSGECDDNLEQILEDIMTEKRLAEEQQAAALKQAAEEAVRRAELLAIAKAAAKAAMPLSLKSSPRKPQAPRYNKGFLPKSISVAVSQPSTPDDQNLFDVLANDNLEVTDEDLMALASVPLDMNDTLDSDDADSDLLSKGEGGDRPPSPILTSLLQSRYDFGATVDQKTKEPQQTTDAEADEERVTVERLKHELMMETSATSDPEPTSSVPADAVQVSPRKSGVEPQTKATNEDDAQVERNPTILQGLPGAGSISSVEHPPISVKQEPMEQSHGPDSEAFVTESETSQGCGQVDVEEPQSPTSSVSSRMSDANKTGAGVRDSGSNKQGTPPRHTPRKRLHIKQEVEGDADAEGPDTDDETLPSDDALSVSTPRHNQSQSQFLLDSLPNSPASLGLSSDTEDEKVYRAWKRSIMLVWRSAVMHKYATVFTHPVTDDIAKGYSSIVFRPMDLSTIKKNVESGVIKTTLEFQRDMMLMFTNALMYNSSNHDVYKMATSMYDDVMQEIEQYVSTQLMLDTKPTPRYSRRSEAASDKEEDQRRRRVSCDTPDGGRKRRAKPDD